MDQPRRKVPRPAKVVRADIDDPPGISPDRAIGGAYGEAWIFAFRGDRPLGKLVIGLENGPVAGDDVGRALRAAFGEGTASVGSNPVPEARFPPVSVVVSSIFSRGESLERCIAAISRLDYPDYEVVLVDNRRDTFAPPAWTDSYPNVRVIREPRPGLPTARNRGWAEARGEVVAFTDDDVEVDPGWLRALATPLMHDPTVGCVTGLVIPKELETPSQRWFEEFLGGFSGGFASTVYRPMKGSRRSLWSPAGKYEVTVVDKAGAREVSEHSLFAAATKCGVGANMAIRTEILRKVGGFDPLLGSGTPTTGCDDVSMFATLLKAGSSIVHEPSAVVVHTHRREYEEFVHQTYAWGKGLTAWLTALSWQDPRNLVGVAVHVLPGLAGIARRPWRVRAEQRSSRPTYPRRLFWYEISGMAAGPIAYVSSRVAASRRQP